MVEVDLQQAMATLETARAQLVALARQEELLRVSLEEYARARETMARYQETPAGTEILVPVGANSFLFAKVAEVERCIVGIGSEVALEDTMDRAIERLDHRMKQLQEVQENLVERIGEVEERVNEYSLAVQQAYAQAQGEEPGV